MEKVFSCFIVKLIICFDLVFNISNYSGVFSLKGGQGGLEVYDHFRGELEARQGLRFRPGESLKIGL